MERELYRRLTNPDKKYLGKPFWSWNGDLEKDELLRQIEVMRTMGFGGFFMHSRTGLVTEYMGEKWFSLVRECAARGEKFDMEAWLYDEDRWPSGTCGGEVTKNQDYRLRFLSEYDNDEEALSQEYVVGIVCRYALLFENGKLKDAISVKGKCEVPSGYTYAVYAEELMANNDVYNGTAYLDTMNAEASQAFFESTLERYGEKCGDMFGKEILGIFTDEPHRGAIFTGFGITNKNKDNMTPYTKGLFAAYRKKYGEELCVPQIYYAPVQGENKTAARYVDILDDLFTQNFAKKYQEYCRKLGLIFTGHILHEDSLNFQTALSGSMMRFYEYMDYPGIDNLSAHNGCYWAVIQCASVARQLKKPFVLSELYGCTGWDMPLNEYKRIGDWQALFGVNLRCPHLSWYSMKGEAKRDYPASILHQNAWYRDWKPLEEYFGRIGIILTEGKRCTDLLVIHPIENMWKLVRKGWVKAFEPNDGAVRCLEESFQKQCMDLIASQHEFDYGDEELMQKYGSIGKDAAGAYLKVGEAMYRTVLLAQGQTVRENTQVLLTDFCALGGKVVQNVSELPKGEVLSAPRNIASAIRRIAGETWLFLMNLSETELTAGAISLSETLECLYAEEWDMVAFESLGDVSLSDLSFEPGQLRIFKLNKESSMSKIPLPGKQIELPEKMAYELSEPNVLVLDRVRWFLNGEIQENGNETDILKLDKKLRIKFRLEPRGGEMLQPWFTAKYLGCTDKSLGRVRVEYRFYSDIETDISIAAEYDSVELNGVTVQRTEGFWIDCCYRLFSGRARKGENIIAVSFDFKRSNDLEAVFVLGLFGVELPNTLVELPKTLSSVHTEKQWLPFYGGAISFHTGIKNGKVSIAAKELHGADLHVSDGYADKLIAFPPYNTSLTLKGELVISLYCTRRNTFGPHHLLPQPQYAYSPESWMSEGEHWTDEYVLSEQGFSCSMSINGDNKNGM